MTKVRIRYFVMFALLVGSRLPSTAHAQEPLSAIFQNLPTADDGDDIWSQAAQAQSTAGPKYTSTAIEMKTFEGIFIPTSNDVELWVFSDDGVDVQVKLGGLPDPPPGDPVQLTRKGTPQHLPNQGQSLHKVNFTFVANQCYGVRVEYQNIIDNGVSDIDGCTLFAIKDDAEVLEVDLDASNVDDDDEEDPGAFVGVNNDDDNDNQTPDKDEDPVSGEDNLLPLALDYTMILSSGTLTLDVTAGSSKVKIWDSANKGTEITLPAEWDLSSETPPTTVYLEGVAASDSERDVTVELKLEQCSNEETDIVKVTVVEIDLDIDSDNNGTIQAADDPIEDDASEPGKILIVNRLDYNTNGVPGFADGINLHGNEGANRSDDFVELKLTVSDAVDLSAATITFAYSHADPSGVTRNPTTGSSPLPVYSPTSSNVIRIWTKTGTASREVESVSGTPAGDYVPPGTHDAEDIFPSETRTVTLYVEGITDSAEGVEQIQVTLDPDGSSGTATNVEDAVRYTSAWLQIVYTDVTGLTGIGNTAAADVPRIDTGIEPDGIAADWQTGVDDGALLLMRIVGSPILATHAGVSIEFGSISGTTFGNVPARDGEYKLLTDGSFIPNAETALDALGIATVGENYDGASRQVLAARFYKPPVEFDTTTPNNTDKERKISLATRVSGGGLVPYQGSKPHAIALVRPPLVLVHGVNSGPGMWNQDDDASFVRRFDTGDPNFGFHCLDFRVDHSGVDPARTGEGATLGFGEISSMYTFVRDMIEDASTPGATNRFRAGDYFSGIAGSGIAGKRIAVQKVDVVAHSYGGLLTRWYIEQSGEFDDRRDVRKLITLGTPHKGSPLANVVCDVFRNPLIENANSEGVFGIEPTMGNLLSGLDIDAFGNPLPAGGVLVGQLPNALTAARTAPRHAYQVFCVNSQRLATLNGVSAGAPFHDDVAYAAVIGTRQNISIPGPDLVYPFDSLQVVWDEGVTSIQRYYFPWIWEFNDGDDDTDGIVPVWSAELGVASHNASIEVDHIAMGANADINAQARDWLNGNGGAVPRGAAQRAVYDREPPISERNAYDGSTVGGGGVSTGGGIRDRAIVKVELGPQSGTDPFDYPATFGTGPTQVGLQPIVLTGMIRFGAIGTANGDFTIQSIHGTDADLHELGMLPQVDLNLQASDTANANGAAIGANDWVAFRITSGRIGRRQSQQVVGPDDHSASDEDALIVYMLPLLPGSEHQSPPARATLPEFALPLPTKGGAGNMTVTVTGAVETRGAGAGTQVQDIRLYHEDGLTDNLLEYLGAPGVTVTHPASVFDGLLIPYSASTTLTLDGGGNVQGTNDSSDANPAQVYQHVIEPGFVDNPSSGTIDVP